MFNRLERLLFQQEIIMATLDDVIANVADEDNTIDSAVNAINGLNAQIAALKTTQTDPATAAKIDALNADITAKKVKLAAAFVVNTPTAVPGAPVVTPQAAAQAASAAVV